MVEFCYSIVNAHQRDKFRPPGQKLPMLFPENGHQIEREIAKRKLLGPGYLWPKFLLVLTPSGDLTCDHTLPP